MISTVALMWKDGLIKDEDIYAQLGQILDGQKSGRDNDDQIIYFNAVGTGILDLAVTTRCYRKALQERSRHYAGLLGIINPFSSYLRTMPRSPCSNAGGRGTLFSGKPPILPLSPGNLLLMFLPLLIPVAVCGVCAVVGKPTLLLQVVGQELGCLHRTEVVQVISLIKRYPLSSRLPTDSRFIST